MCINIAQQQYHRKLIGLPELYTVDKREAPIQIQVSYVVTDALRPFIKSTDLVKSGSGFNLPADYVAFVASGYLFVELVNGQNIADPVTVDFLTTTEWQEKRQNYITKPTLEYPAATFENNQIIVEPTSLDNLKIRYYRYPVTPVRAFTINANDQDVYDPANSVQLEFPSNDWENIAHVVVSYWATWMRDIPLKQIENNRIVGGQG